MFQLLKNKIFICVIISLTLSGQKSNAIKCQKDSIATANDFLDLAQKAFSASDRQISEELLQKYIHGVLCCAIFEIKFKNNNFILEKNFFNAQKIQKDFCLELSKGNSIEKAAEKIENMAINLVKELAEDQNIKKNIQKSLEANQNSLKLEEINVNFLKTELSKNFSNENLNKLTSLFYLGLNQFFNSLKELENFGKNEALASVVGHRQKRANFHDNIRGSRENDQRRAVCATLLISTILSAITVLSLMIAAHNANLSYWRFLVISVAFYLFMTVIIKVTCSAFFNTNTSNTIQLGFVQP